MGRDEAFPVAMKWPESGTAQSRGLRFNSTLVSHAAGVLRWFDCAALEGAHCTRDLGSEILSITAQAA
jgi:hypothetical protein